MPRPLFDDIEDYPCVDAVLQFASPAIEPNDASSSDGEVDEGEASGGTSGPPRRVLDRQAALARAASVASIYEAFVPAGVGAPVRGKISTEVRSIRQSSQWRRGPVRSREPAVATPPWKARRL